MEASDGEADYCVARKFTLAEDAGRRSGGKDGAGTEVVDAWTAGVEGRSRERR